MLSIQLLLLPINILGNWVLMFGHWGFSPMGSNGAALATGIAQVLGFVLLTLYSFYSQRYAHLELKKRFVWPDLNHLFHQLKLGIPISISMAMEVGMFTIITLLMGRFGVDVVASHQIALNLASLTFMLPLGISMAVTVRTSQALGSSKPIEAMNRGRLGLGLCLIAGSFSALLFILIPETLASLYTDKPHLITLATELLGIAALFQLVDSLQIGGSGVLLGYKDTRIPMILSIICFWGGGLAVATISAFYLGLGPHGLWYGLTAGLALASIAVNIRFYILAKRSISESVREREF